MRNKQSTTACLVLVALMTPVTAMAADPSLPSGWRRTDVTIDGSADEWAGKIIPIERTPLSIGVQNDARFLFICVRTSDETAKKQILTRGLSLYLDASGKDHRGFGVRFPLGSGRSGRAGEAGPDGPPQAASGTELVFLGAPDGERIRISVSAARPVEAALGEKDGVLVLEMKVPLAFSADSPHAIETQPGKSISLGLETTEPDRKPSHSGGGHGAGGSGGHGGGGFNMGGGGGGRGSHGGGGQHGSGQHQAEGSPSPDGHAPLKAWLTVELAAAPAP